MADNTLNQLDNEMNQINKKMEQDGQNSIENDLNKSYSKPRNFEELNNKNNSLLSGSANSSNFESDISSGGKGLGNIIPPGYDMLFKDSDSNNVNNYGSNIPNGNMSKFGTIPMNSQSNISNNTQNGLGNLSAYGWNKGIGNNVNNN